MSFTAAQEKAITSTGNILLTAGAGTGKTHTLVERCLRCLTAGTGSPPASIQEILMVTFTEAAAAEMRHRIRARLEKEAQGDPANRHWQEQLALFETAHIGTLHGFCLELVRQHFHTLSLDPQLAVMPKEEAQLLSEETLELLLEEHYTGTSASSANVTALVRSHGRNGDATIRAMVLKLHNFTQTLPDPDGWLAGHKAATAETAPEEWTNLFLTGFEAWRQEQLIVLSSPAHQNEVGDPCWAELNSITRNSPPRDIAKALAAIQLIQKDAPRGIRGRCVDPLEAFFKDAAFLASLLPTTGGKNPLQEDWDWTRPGIAALLDLTVEFGERFARAKRETGMLDFHDLEQHTLTLLWDRKKKEPTEIARHWRDRLKHVFVDEYQDINAAQDLILTALSRDAELANRFLVGDVKQSIYRFRLADPTIFQDYSTRWQAAGSHSIPLVDNFRSHESLLGFVNSVFGDLMRPHIGGVAYDDRARLVFGSAATRADLSCANDPSPRVELHLRRRTAKQETQPHGEDEGQAEEPENIEESAREARIVAARLRELKQQEFKVWRDGKSLPVAWKDMAVLLRAPSTKSEIYAREFARMGVPLLVDRPGFYDALEVCDLLNLLQILDNPIQDVPLLAVLRSPLCGLDLTELATIRMVGKGPFWTALTRWKPQAGAGDCHAKTAEKVATFLRRFATWRRLARQGSMDRCLENVLAETRYDLWLESQPRGPQKAINVKRFISLARQFGQFQRQGLFRFLRFVEAQKEANAEPETPPTVEQDAVRLMSIHQSKGLEFPVVALPNLEKPFNQDDLKSEIILDKQLGICPLVCQPGSRARYPSLPHWLARRKNKLELLGDEIRLLYVAFTRARDLLILSATIAEKKITQFETPTPGTIPDADLAKAGNYLDWLALWFAANVGKPLGSGQTSLLTWELHEESTPAAAPGATPSESVDAETRPGVEPPPMTGMELERLRRILDWKYQFPRAMREPAKASVSALRRRTLQQEDDLARPIRSVATRWPEAPSSSASKPTAAEAGSALHLFMQHVRLDSCHTGELLDQERSRLVQNGTLTKEQSTWLPMENVLHFFTSEVGLAIRAEAAKVRRELPFTCRIPLGDIPLFEPQSNDSRPKPPLPLPGMEDISTNGQHQEFVVVQGAADLVVLLPGEIWLLDFKTDHVKPDDLDSRVHQYEPQLALYSRALEQIYRRPVTRCWLHFLTLRQSVPLHTRQPPLR